MISVVNSMGLNGLEAFKVVIESDVTPGMPSCDIVGLPDISIKESKNRVRSAIKSSGFTDIFSYFKIERSNRKYSGKFRFYRRTFSQW